MLILISGQDTFRSREKLALLVGEFKRKYGNEAGNICSYEGETLSRSSLHQAVLAKSLWASRRLLIIKNLSLGDFDASFAAHVLAQVPKENIVIVYEGGEQERYKKTLHHLKPDHHYNFESLGGKELERWIISCAAKNNLMLQKQDVAGLMQAFGNNLWKLNSELKKMALYKTSATPTTAPGIRPGIGENKIFGLVDAVTLKKKDVALHLLREELHSGTAAEQILGLFGRQIKILLAVKNHTTEAHALAVKLSVHPFVFDKARKAAGAFSQAELENLQSAALQYDQLAKRGIIKPEYALHQLILQATSIIN